MIDLVSKLCGPKARTLLLEYLNDITKSECQRANMEDVLKTKELTIKDLSGGQHARNLQDKVTIARSDNEIVCLKERLLEKENEVFESNQELDDLRRELEEAREQIQELQAKKKRKKKVTTDDGEEVDMTVFDVEIEDLDFEDGNDSDWHPTPAKRRKNRAEKNKNNLNSSIIMKSFMNDESMAHQDLSNGNGNDLTGLNVLDQHEALLHLDSLTVPQLKELCRQRHLLLKGRKEELLLRLRKDMYEEQSKSKKQRSSIGSSSNDGRHVSFAELSPIIKHSPTNREIETTSNLFDFQSTDFENDSCNKGTDDVFSALSNNAITTPRPSEKEINEFASVNGESVMSNVSKSANEEISTSLPCANEEISAPKQNRESDMSDVSKSTNGETNSNIFFESLRSDNGNKIKICTESKENENKVDMVMSEVSPSSTSESNDKLFFQSLRSNETKRHEEKTGSRKHMKKTTQTEKHIAFEVNGSTNKENEVIFLHSLRNSTSDKKRPLEIRKKSPVNGEGRKENQKTESKKKVQNELEKNVPHYRRPLESKVFKRRDDLNSSMTYEDNQKAFFNSFRSNSNCPQKTPSSKRKFVVEASNENGSKRRKQMINLNKQMSENLNKQINETEKMLEEL